MKKRTLRQRLIFTTVVIVTVTSTLFASGVLLIKQRLEEATFGAMVSEHLSVLLAHPEQARVLTNPMFDEWKYYRGDTVAQLPAAIRAKPEGVYHSIAINEDYYHLQVSDTPAGKAYLMYDVTEWEQQEHALLYSLACGIVIVLVVALLMASRAASSILEPVRRLTARLAVIQPGQRNLRIADEFQDSDVGQIASAFDMYSARIDNFVERERSFTAAASHELRTPLSVMLGAVDVIEASAPTPAGQRALERIRRACGEMQAFIEATLFLSREEDNAIRQGSATEVAAVISEVVDDNRNTMSSAGITMHTDLAPGLRLDVPHSIVKITIANLLRNAIEHTPGGDIYLALADREFCIRDTGEGIAEAQLPHVFDRSYSTKPGGTGLGLNMVKRICDRFGWGVKVNSDLGQGTEIRLCFDNR